MIVALSVQPYRLQPFAALLRGSSHEQSQGQGRALPPARRRLSRGLEGFPVVGTAMAPLPRALLLEEVKGHACVTLAKPEATNCAAAKPDLPQQLLSGRYRHTVRCAGACLNGRNGCAGSYVSIMHP